MWNGDSAGLSRIISDAGRLTASPCSLNVGRYVCVKYLGIIYELCEADSRNSYVAAMFRFV